MRRRSLLATVAAAAPAARAQTGGAWPQRTVTLVVPSAPGGTLDALARFFAQAMSPGLGRAVVVENVGGAGGLIGMQRGARAEPDGHTIVFGNMGVMAASVALNPDSGYDPRRDLAPVGMAAHVPMVLAASPQSGVRDLQELLARIRKRGEGVTFGTAGLGTTSHLAPALLMHLTGLKATLVSYRGAGPAMNDLAAGVVDAVIDQTVTMIPAHRGRTAVPLAVSGAQLVPQLPEVPTFAEAGAPYMAVDAWFGLFAPAGSPAAVVARLSNALLRILAEPDFAARLAGLGFQPAPLPAAEFAAFQRAEVARWEELAALTGIRLEG